MLLFSAYPLPTREATCGIFVIGLPGTGRVIVPVLMAMSLLGMGWGLYILNLWSAASVRLRKHLSSMMFLTVMISLGLFLSFTSGWISTLPVLIVTLLLMIILLGSLAVDKSR